MGFRTLASFSGQADNIVLCPYLMEVGIAPWMLLLIHAREADKNKIATSIGVEAEQYMNLDSCFKLATWYIKYIIFLLHYFHCKIITDEGCELEIEKMLLNLIQVDSD